MCSKNIKNVIKKRTKTEYKRANWSGIRCKTYGNTPLNF
nr:MAG TPA: hypothetical protein [Caudoviricetes sp.]